MIEMSLAGRLASAFPGAYLAIPQMGKSYLFDRDQSEIGYFDWHNHIVYLRSDYKHAKLAKQACEANGLKYKHRGF